MALEGIYNLWNHRYAGDTSAAMAAVAQLGPAVVVTGASKGIGLAVAKKFRRAGFSILMIARGEDELRAAGEKITGVATDQSRARAEAHMPAGRPVQVMTLALDITAPDAFQRIEQCLAENGCYLDILINNAGIGFSGEFRHQPLERIDAMNEVNVVALSRLTRLVLPQLMARGRGGIINIASLGGLTPGPFQAQYYASKSYVVSLTRALAFETRGIGVRMSVVVPGPVDTDFHEDMAAENSIYRWVLPHKSAEAVADSTFNGYWLGHRTIVPGFLYWLAIKIIGVVPYAVLVPVMGGLLWPGKRRKAETARADQAG